jgi:hypothetical protein
MVFGAAASIREAMASSMDPFDRAEYERNLQTLRAELGQAKFRAAWEVGRALTMEQALEAALEKGESPKD